MTANDQDYDYSKYADEEEGQHVWNPSSSHKHEHRQCFQLHLTDTFLIET